MSSNETLFLKLSQNIVIYSNETQKYTFIGNKGEQYKYKLENIEILNNEIYKSFLPKDKETNRSWVICKANIYLGNLKTVILVYMQIFENITTRKLNDNERLNFKTDSIIGWPLVLSINISDYKTISSVIDLNSRENEIIKFFNLSKSIDINLKEEINKINNDKEIYINNRKIGDNGKEWIKLLGLRTWCAKQSNKFILPKTHKLSNNPNFYEAIKILSDIPVTIQIASLQFAVDLENYNKTLDDIKTKTIIDNSYKLFCLKCEKEYIFELLKEKKFKKEDIISALGKNVEKGLINEFILFLKNNNFLLN